MSGTCNKGFSLIEILVAVAIIAVIASVIIPAIWRRSPAQERKLFFGQLNALTHYARQQAIMTNNVHQVYFDLEKRIVTIQKETDIINATGNKQFAPIKNIGFKKSINIPLSLSIKQLLIEGIDAMKLFAGRATKEIWFFIVPQGLAQLVTIFLIDTKDKDSRGKPHQTRWELNPFTAQFTAYDEL